MKKLLTIALLILVFSCQKTQHQTKKAGAIFGTSYMVIYDAEADYQNEFDSLFYEINKSMSTYQTNSLISRINRNEIDRIDEWFQTVLIKSKEIYAQTNGAFDPTIGAVVNAWDFGPEGQIQELDSMKIDSLMRSVGLEKVVVNEFILSKPKDTYLDFNAIAKGYAVDVIAEFLEKQGIANYLVEIGGEIRAKGINTERNVPWTVGLDQPNFEEEQHVMRTLQLFDEAMATSGTYRKFKTDDQGNRYAHIIDTKTGSPSKTNILSVSVITSDCMTADAYATAFQAMGLEKVKLFLQDHPELKVFLIFENDNKDLETLALNGFPEN